MRLHGVQHITGRAVRAFTSASRCLKVLDVRSCARITSADVAKAQAQLPSCRVITGEGDPLDDVDIDVVAAEHGGGTAAAGGPDGGSGAGGADIAFV